MTLNSKNVEKNKRVAWIDIAKGIAIILMIIGHYAPYGSTIRNFIFSFHMPLFYVLSGYNMKKACSLNECFQMVKRDIKKLYIPSIIVVAITQIIYGFYSNIGITEIIMFCIKRIIWGNGCDYQYHNMHLMSFGVLWFIISIIFAKMLYRVICLYVNENICFVSIILLCVLAIILGQKIWLPQSIDLAIVGCFFIACGQVYKRYEIEINKRIIWIALVAATIWSVCLQFGIYIEMATRMYPYGFVSVIEALCACLLIIVTCKYMEKIKLISMLLAFIGIHSFGILLIHHFELFTGIYSILKINLLIRIILDCTIALLFTLLKTKILRILNKNKSKEELLSKK